MNLLKRACVNLIRMPVRNLLYLTVIFIMVLITVICGKIYNVGKTAKSKLITEYPIIATVIPKSDITPEGIKISLRKLLNLDELSILLKSDSVYAYNISLNAGMLAEEEILFELPDNQILSADPLPSIDIKNNIVLAVNNLMMEQEFLNGSYRIIEGENFSDDDVYNGNAVIIISKTIADMYGLNVGEHINYKVSNSNAYRQYEVKGIYESVSGEDIYLLYIPICDLFHDWANFMGGDSLVDREYNGIVSRTKDSVARLDFNLKGSEYISDFISDAIENGLDFKNFEIIVNDKGYKTAEAGISDVTRISLFILILALSAGFIIIISITVYCRGTRIREAMILHCLGMKRFHITVMFAFEILIVFAVSGGAGITGGIIFSNALIEEIRSEYIVEIQKKANKNELIKEFVIEFKTAAMSYPLSINMDNSYKAIPFETLFTPAKTADPNDGRTWIREEKFNLYGTSDTIIVTGYTNILSNGKNGDEILEEVNRITGYEFECTAGKDSGYAIGDTIRLCKGDIGSMSAMVIDFHYNKTQYISPKIAYINLRVAGLNDEENISVAMKDLELICSYMGASSSIYRSVRYDRVLEAD